MAVQGVSWAFLGLQLGPPRPQVYDSWSLAIGKIVLWAGVGLIENLGRHRRASDNIKPNQLSFFAPKSTH